MFNIYNIMPSKHIKKQKRTKKHKKSRGKRSKKYTRTQRRKKKNKQVGGNMFTDFFFKRGKPTAPKEENKQGGLFNLDAKLDNMFGMFKKDVMGAVTAKMSESANMAKNTGLGMLGANSSGLDYEFLEKALREYFKGDVQKAAEVISFIKDKKEKKEGVAKVENAEKKENKELNDMLNDVNKKPDAPAGDAPAGDAPAGDAPAGDAPAGDKPKEKDDNVLKTADITVDEESPPIELNTKDLEIDTEELK